jgi:tetratricopeptide (TPR) repeat protein
MTTPALSINPKSGSILIVEAIPGAPRKHWLKERAEALAGQGGRVSVFSCDFDLGGPWAGVNALLSPIIPEIEQQRPELLVTHSFELVHVIPPLRRTLEVSNPTLTDVAADDEKVRNYAADRAYRIVHGLIDLLDSWKSSTSAGVPWIIGCDAYDSGGPLSQYFFQELMRRRGSKLNIQLLVSVAMEQGEKARSTFNAALPVNVMPLDLPTEPAPVIEPAESLRRATELAERVGDDRIEMQVHLSELITLWQQAGRPDKVLRCRYFGLAFYSKLGLYADALRYGRGLLDIVAQYEPDNISMRWWIIIKLLNAYTGLAAVDEALALCDAAMKEAEHLPLAWGIHLYYMTAMLYARYKSPRDLVKGEELLDRGLKIIQEADIPEDERHFRAVFNRNGVAMIRSFQGRFQEAIELCRTGLEELNAHLDIDKHRLHRSILLYNIAQVYVATNSHMEAVRYYSAAMEMDPNYSEYYNERGNVYLRMGKLAEALADYQKAIKLSPPYFEVFTNLGQCYRRMGKMGEAVQAYSRSIDLQPLQPLALSGRAKAQEELGNANEAIADYTASLQLDARQWDAYASRAILYYEKRELQQSLSDLNCAIDLEPNMIDLYRNRSVVLMDLGRPVAAAQDLHAALRLNPSEEDKIALEEMLKTSEAAVSEQPTLKGA